MGDEQIEAPAIYALVCVASNTVEYTSTVLSAVKGFFDCLPDEVRDFFVVVTYRAEHEKLEE